MYRRHPIFLAETYFFLYETPFRSAACADYIASIRQLLHHKTLACDNLSDHLGDLSIKTVSVQTKWANNLMKKNSHTG